MKTTKESLGDRVRHRMIKIVNAKYSVPSWLWVMASIAVGIVIFLYGLSDPSLIREFTDPLPFNGLVWGGGVALSGVLAGVGMATDATWVVRLGAFVSFSLWIFGAISFYLSGGIANVIIFGGPMLVFWAYKYVASYVREFPRL
jgi:hypothetical protein